MTMSDGTGTSISRFIDSEMIISRGFMVSAQKMFGNGYKAIIRNLSHDYGANIIKYLANGDDLDSLSDTEKLQLLFERGIVADAVDVGLDCEKLILTTEHCMHHSGIAVREEIEIPETRVCPVGILGTCLIQNILHRGVVGRRKDAGAYDETGKCVIRFDLAED